MRRLLEVDLWEISIVTFPMLAQATIEAVKRRRPRRPAPIDVLTMKLARLRAHRAAEAFETKLRLLSHALERRYSPNQPRDDIGRWTSGSQRAASFPNRDSPNGGQTTNEQPVGITQLDCDKLYELDSAICRMLDSKIQRAKSWASAADRMAACIGGGSILPLRY